MTTPHERPSVQGKRASLFVTCIVDMIYPTTGMSTVEILERIGIAVNFPEAQTCCGQMGFNAGYRDEAKAVAKQFILAFADSEVIVSPSGSCVAMVRDYYPQLFRDDAEWEDRALAVAARTWELSEYLVDGLGITDVGGKLPAPHTAAIHDSCHGLRELGLKKQARALLANVGNLTLVNLNGAEQCCGFGGLFAVKMPEVSGAMLRDKMNNISACGADIIITGDASCLTQMNGGLHRNSSPQRVVHLADVLAGKVE